MRLKKVHVTEFQSIRDSNSFSVGDITCLVGKNEAGKTALLQALYRLNPLIEKDGVFSVTDDYPRADVSEYKNAVAEEDADPAVVTRAEFELTPEEMAGVKEAFGDGIFAAPTLTLSKGYENKLTIGLNVDESCAVKSFIVDAQLPEPLATRLSSAHTVKDLHAASAAVTEPENAEHIKRLQAKISAIKGRGSLVLHIYNKYIEPHVPLFAYFDEYYLMRGIENVEALRDRKAQDKLRPTDMPLLGLLDIARLKPDELLNVKRTQDLLNTLEGAGNYLSKKILKYWSQNKHIKMDFDLRHALPEDPEEMRTGTNVFTLVEDTRRRSSTQLGTRSRGFVWFFSFLAWYELQKRQHPNLILLLDEPGLFLHGRAQGDLLRYIEEELKGSHQVVYTTHSPFMVDATKFDRVRIVQDRSIDIDVELPKTEDGTKMLTDVLEANDDSLFPLQGALGYDICQTLFIGPNCLIVEGVSDLLFLQTLSALLGPKGLDKRWVITPVGGLEKVPTFVALLGAQKGLNIAALVDFQKKDQQTVENLYKRKLLTREKVITFDQFTGTVEADIEDMFDPTFYVELVRAEYASVLPEGRLDSSALPATSPRIVRRLEAHFAVAALRDGEVFSHYRPARRLAESVSSLSGGISKETLSRFEALFQRLNALLPR